MTRTAIRLAALVGLGLATACAPVVVVDPGPAPARDACGAARLQRFVGRPYAELRPRLDPRLPTRVLRPGDVVTMDYRADRLNVELDRRGRIRRIRCG
ncbi:MAG: hypothetical protein KatS3mg118_3063 [Paracoccaceae bacterium]|nr:MAG: hypothetical protein D6686_04030 [Alphaproteobacteria bacterium]GIX15104.1 MAG: hypothetical protein KatS3mg118_3063 [Paracoccaceae bacterium]